MSVNGRTRLPQRSGIVLAVKILGAVLTGCPGEIISDMPGAAISRGGKTSAFQMRNDTLALRGEARMERIGNELTAHDPNGGRQNAI